MRYGRMACGFGAAVVVGTVSGGACVVVVVVVGSSGKVGISAGGGLSAKSSGNGMISVGSGGSFVKPSGNGIIVVMFVVAGTVSGCPGDDCLFVLSM